VSERKPELDSWKKKAQELLDEEELEVLWESILDNESEPTGLEKRINYDSFCIIGSRQSEKSHKFFKASVFLKFPRDQHGRISARAFFRYVMRKVRLTRLRISLTCYDEIGQGYLREQDLENYVFEQIPSLPQLQGLEQDFYPYYVFTAVRKFMFFLDPMRKGKVSIRDIVASPILHQFNQLRQKQDSTQAQKAARKRDWFSSRSALEVYATYLQLDVDHNGMLSKSEFLKYGNGGLTEVFVDRVFQEYLMYKSKESGQLEMDYKTFLDFVLAMDNRSTPQSLQYFWRVLDIQRVGYLNIYSLNFFFSGRCAKKWQNWATTVSMPGILSRTNYLT